MKTLRLTLFGLLMMLVSVSLFACNDGKNKVIKSVAQDGLKNFYHVTEVQKLSDDFSNLKLTATYDDGSKKEMTKAEFDIDENNAQQDTEFVVSTDGLFQQLQNDELTKDEYDITCKIIGGGTFSLLTVTVSDNQNLIYTMTQFTLPENIQARQNALKIEDGEGAFYDREQTYVVGDDNPFVFMPKATFLNKKTHEDAALEHFNVDLTVTKIGEQSQGIGETVLDESQNDFYTFDNDTFGIQFKPAAVGETFKISMLPTDFPTNVNGDNWPAATLTFQVQDGWNAYDATDLARINIIPDTVDKNDYMYAVSSARYIPQGGNLTNLDTFKAWEDYFAAHEEIYGENPEAINAIFLHDNIALESKDIPEEYFVKESESQFAKGSIRDFTFIYAHHLDEDFTINGNNFTIDVSALPLGKSNTTVGGYFFEKIDDATQRPAHSSVFAFLGKEEGKEGQFNADGNGYFKNLNAIGNTGEVISGGDTNEVLLASQSEMLLKANSCHVEVDNCIAKNFLIGWYANQYRNDDGRGSMSLNHVKTYDCFNSAVFLWASTGFKVTKSEFKRFGGPIALTVSRMIENGAGQPDTPCPSDITFDDETVLENYVNGDEAWFVSMGQTGIVTLILGDLGQYMPAGNSLVAKQEGAKPYLNLICLNMDEKYQLASKPALGSFQKGETTKFNTNGQVEQGLFLASGGRSPVFVSGDKAAIVTDAEHKTLSFFNTANMTPASDTTKFDGEYLSVFYNVPNIGKGIGFTVELVQTAQS